jgi:hypothetical protein
LPIAPLPHFASDIFIDAGCASCQYVLSC